MAAHSDTPFKRLPVKIIGTGSYVPERRLTNADLEKMVDTSHEWIIERTGIVERRIAAPDEYTSHMGTKAAQRALESCGLKPEDIDLIIVATITPDTFTPSTSCYIQDALGAKNAAAFDISAACSGFLFAMKTAVQYIGTGQMKTALIIAAEKLSTVVNWEDRSTCVLFGDGAGAVVLRAELYAVAALVGAGIVVGGHLLGLPVVATAVAGGLACFALRLLALRRGWRLPVAGGAPPPDGDA